MRRRILHGLAVAAISLALPAAAHAQTFTVTTTTDSGAGSLRAAIDDSNATAGPNTIDFALSGSGVQTIQAASPLPAITVPVTIDATSQPGYLGTPLVDLDGALSGGGSGLVVDASNTVVRGLEITDWRCGGLCAGVELAGTADFVGNDFIGTDGTSAMGNDNGVVIDSGTMGDAVGSSPGDGDVVSGNLENGVVDKGEEVEILGDDIGTNAAGDAALSNGSNGVLLQGSADTVIGASVDPNIISGNGGDGVLVVDSSDTSIEGNLIGVAASGLSPVGNEGDGVGITDDATATAVGTTTAGTGNVIADNGDNGVSVLDGGTLGNSIVSDSIFANGNLGTRLDDGGNGVPPAPVVSSATTSDGTTTVAGTVAAGTHLVQVYANASCADPEGQTHLADATVTGTAWSLTVPTQPTGTGITATATDTASSATTAFSACTPVVLERTLTVTALGDGNGTVAFAPSGDDCDSSCSHLYADGTSVTLTATPAGGGSFSGWSGGGCSGTGTCTVALNADATVQATFAAAPVVTSTVTASVPTATTPTGTPPTAPAPPPTTTGTTAIGGPGAPPSIGPAAPPRVSDIGVTTTTIVWCSGCSASPARLRFQLTRATPVRLVLLTHAAHGFVAVAASVLHGHAGLNEPRIVGRWHGRLVSHGPVRIELELRSDGRWTTAGTVRLTVRRHR